MAQSSDTVSGTASGTGSRRPFRESVRARSWTPLLVATLALAGTLVLAYAGKAVCIDGEPGFWGQTRYCYSDVRVLWSLRGFDVDAVPFAGPPEGYPADYTLEYPPALAFPAWMLGLATESRAGFFNLHALTFVIASFGALFLLDSALRARGAAARSRWRLLGFALSPGLVLFGMQNWDLWSVGLVAAGLAAAARRRPYLAAVAFAVGAGVKWWPALLVVPLLVGPWAPEDEQERHVLDRLRVGDLRLGPAVAAFGVWALAQLPGIVVSPSGWWEAVRFHLRRSANLDSAAAAISEFGNDLVETSFWVSSYSEAYTVVSLLALVAGIGYVGWRLAEGTLEPGNAVLALVALFLLTSKVFSPQFVLWLLPVAVLARVRWLPVLAVEASNAVVWLLYGPFIAHLDDPAFHGFLTASQGMALVRAAAVAWLLVEALRAVEGSMSLNGA